MDKEKVIAFFDSLAEKWDGMQVRNEHILEAVLDFAGVFKGAEVLDVACGTGVLFPDYFKRGVKSITGIDISPGMLALAGEKFPDAKLICADAEEYDFEESYDVIMIYNAFPHFSNPERLFENLTRALKEGGRLTVAHGISRQEVEKCHSSVREGVSSALPCAEKTAEIMSPFLDTDVIVSDERMYVVSGVKKK